MGDPWGIGGFRGARGGGGRSPILSKSSKKSGKAAKSEKSDFFFFFYCLKCIRNPTKTPLKVQQVSNPVQPTTNHAPHECKQHKNPFFLTLATLIISGISRYACTGGRPSPMRKDASAFCRCMCILSC